MNTRKNIYRILVLFILSSACLLFSGCFITNGEHFLWF